MRQHLGRSVLVVAILASIATSKAPDNVVPFERDVYPFGPDVVHIRVRFNHQLVLESERLEVRLETGGGKAQVIPDDPAQAPMTLDDELWFEVTDRCPQTGTCELGFSIDPDGPESNAMLRITASGARQGEGCLFTSNDFSGGAKADVIVD